MANEITALHRSKHLSKRLRNLEFLLAEVYRGLDYRTTTPPSCDAVWWHGSDFGFSLLGHDRFCRRLAS
jgi:hypothetical protein